MSHIEQTGSLSNSQAYGAAFIALAYDGSRLSEAEVYLLREKETLTRAVEALRLRRQAVAKARQKAEEELCRLAREDEARRHANEAALSSSEAERQRVVANANASRHVAAERPPHQIEVAPARLHERLRELALSERQSAEQTEWGGDRLRLVETPALRNKGVDRAKEASALEQRLRAEIEGLAAAQRSSVEAARAQVRLRRNTNPSHTSAVI